MIDVNGRATHVIRKNNSQRTTPTVVFEGGFAQDAIIWHLVQEKVAAFAPTLAYDRAGLGWSAPSDTKRDATQIATELDALLDTLTIDRVVMVGHSMGGIYARRLWQHNPERVAGMVFVESAHEDMDNHMPSEVLPVYTEIFSGIAAAFKANTEKTHMELLAEFGNPQPDPDGIYPLEIQQLQLDRIRPGSFAASHAEMIYHSVLLRQGPEGVPDLGDLPIVVLSSEQRSLNTELPAELNQQYNQWWQRFQDAQATMSTHSAHYRVKGGHELHIENAQTVATAVETVLGMLA